MEKFTEIDYNICICIPSLFILINQVILIAMKTNILTQIR